MRGFASALALALSISGTALGDEMFTAAQVLEWTRTAQDSFFETSVSMAGVIAVQAENPAGPCINDWYFKTDDATRKASDEIRSVMQQYSSYYPGIVIVAVIEKNCGDLTPAN